MSISAKAETDPTINRAKAIPGRDPLPDELTEEELESVAGGGSGSGTPPPPPGNPPPVGLS